ncbi:sugar transferase [Saliphagus sp. GCM10025308]
MLKGWQYRIVSAGGILALTITAVLIANHPIPQHLFTTYVPLFNRLEPTVLDGESLRWAVALSTVAVVGALLPLYKPQPRRALDTIFIAEKRVVVAGLAMATLGYFKWSHRLPRQTLTMTVAILAVVVPVWFFQVRRRPAGETGRTLIVGDDLHQIKRVAPAIDAPIIGYLCPTRPTVAGQSEAEVNGILTDGGTIEDHQLADLEAAIDEYGRLGAMTRLGGLSRLEDVLVEYDVDTVVLAFFRADRAEFFGALDACHEHGVEAKVHREYASSVLVNNDDVGELVDVDLEPWDPLDHVFKRLFDVMFALVGLVVFAPLMVVIAVAVKLDSRGPVLYKQHRTAGFGETFPVYKFRSMVPEGDSAEPVDDESNDRITRVGQMLRKTHLDELPQLWAILIGKMSVVGPRAAWTEEETLLEEDTPAWRKRWFVKPGLTGLAQINDAKSTDPRMKLRYDLEYIRKQSFWFDLKIVIRQVWNVLEDSWETIRR